MSSTRTPKARLAGPPLLDPAVYASLVDAAPARIAMMDRRRRLIYGNAEFLKFIGATPDDIVGQPVWQIVGRDVARRIAPLAHRALAGETLTWTGWIAYTDRHGNPPVRRRFVDRVYAPVSRPDGRIFAYMIVTRDLTELKLREDDLRQRTTELEAILAEIGEGVTITATDGRLVLASPAFLRSFGFPAELGRPGMPHAGLIRHRLERGGHYAHEDRAKSIDRLVAERLAAVVGPDAVMHQDVEVAGRPIEIRRRRLPDGTMVATYTDMSARQEAERARHAQRDALRRAERLSATASLLAGVAHEVNNPLAIVTAQAQLLADEAAGTPLADRAAKVERAAVRCGRIVTSLLASARSAAMRREPFALADSVASAIDLVGYDLGNTGIRVQVDVPRRLPMLYGDPDQLTHLVANLLTNAAAALRGQAGPGHVAITARPTARTIVLRVADNGPGVPAPLRSRVFDPFFTTRLPGEGTGIGLALCRTIAMAHGGGIAVEDTPGGGATFVVRFGRQRR